MFFLPYFPHANKLFVSFRTLDHYLSNQTWSTNPDTQNSYAIKGNLVSGFCFASQSCGMCAPGGGSGPAPFTSPKEKTGDALTTWLKAAVAIILTFSVSISLYMTLHGTTRPAFFPLPAIPDPILKAHSATNISHIAFGISGSAQTWEARGRYLDLWWKPGITRGFVFLDEEPAAKGTRFKIRHRVSSDWKRFRYTAGSDSAVRIARVVVDLFRAGLPDVRWFVMGDDDTVFFPENLAAVLAKYDHRRMVYVGGNSESVEQDVMHSYGMAFGGGGFALSYALAERLVGAMDGCLDRYHYFYGSDQRVWACVAEFGVGLSRESGFHQMDIRGNLFGLLAAHPVAPLVSLHHLDSVNPLFPNRTRLEALAALMVAYNGDPSRTLQQCFCYHRKHQWSVSIAWGYAVQVYPILLTATDLETPLQTFQTWRTYSHGPFTFSTRPVDSDPCRRSVVFVLDTVKARMGNEMTQTVYRKSWDKPVERCDANHARAMALERIVVSAPKMDPGEWKQTPQRHCCEIQDESSVQGTMRIRIRKCKDKERIAI